MQNLWYYVDPFIGNSSVREDTNVGKELHLVNDYVAEFQFKGGDTIAVLKKDSNGDGTGDTIVTTAMDPRVQNQGYCSITSSTKCTTDAGCPAGETCAIQGIVNADDINSLWRAGKNLWSRNLSTSPRKLYTYLAGSTASTCGGGAFSVAGLYDLAAIDWGTISTNDKCIIKSFLQASTDAEAQNIIKFAHGYDSPDIGTIDGKTPRNRSVQIGGSKKVWKLGDIVASTPRIQSFNKLNNYHVDSPAGYGDMTYADNDVTSFCTGAPAGVSCNAGGDCPTGETCSGGKGFANSSAYKARGMAYAGANDGMLHAFKLGSLSVKTSGLTKARLEGSGLGEEQWAFIPKNVLPYLKYLSDPDYSHLYLVDGPTRLLDASIGYNNNSYIPAASRGVYSAAGCDAGGSGDHTKYWACKTDPATDSNQSWRSILIGSMGIGGASAELGSTCTNCVNNPVTGVGKSSYFALDITDPVNPRYLWEFSHADMGYSTTGAAVARVSHEFVASGTTYKDTNGRWFAVIGSGPTGPIDTTFHQFKGKSANPLSVFVLDLKNGQLLKKFATTINNAFAGSMASAPIDTDRSRKLDAGFYSDDALYFGYSNCTSDCDTDTPAWNGGIMRLLTAEKIHPVDPGTGVDNWSLSTLISNVGPVSTAIGKLQDRKFKNLWLYTGSGRYFFKGDDSTDPGMILAVKEPCYSKVNDDIYSTSAISGQTPPCTTEIVFAAGDFAGQTSTINTVDGKKGWFIDLLGEDTTNNFGAERIITEPVPMPNGAVFFTSFMPSTDICNYGGKSFLWGMRYDTGGTASAEQLKGKALVQVSTGSFEEVNLSSALTAELGRKMGTPMIGKPPTDPPPIVSSSGNKPLKRILHIQEK
jgi:type IV pilus assembly protein PilY1